MLQLTSYTANGITCEIANNYLQWVPVRSSASGRAKIDHVSGMTIYPRHLKPRHWVPCEPPTSYEVNTLKELWVRSQANVDGFCSNLGHLKALIAANPVPTASTVSKGTHSLVNRPQWHQKLTMYPESRQKLTIYAGYLIVGNPNSFGTNQKFTM